MSEQTNNSSKAGRHEYKSTVILRLQRCFAVKKRLLVMYLEIAIPIMPSFIKFDFSDLPTTWSLLARTSVRASDLS